MLLVDFLNKNLPQNFINPENSELKWLEESETYHKAIENASQDLEDLKQQENEQNNNKLTRSQIDLLVEQYRDIQKIKQEKDIIDSLIRIDEVILQISKIPRSDQSIKRLRQTLESLIQEASVVSKLQIQPDFLNMLCKSKMTISSNKYLSNDIEAMGNKVIGQGKNKKLAENDQEQVKEMIELINFLSQDSSHSQCTELRLQIGSLLFNQQMDQLKFHFLGKESKLNTIERPDWLFKYIIDQMELIETITGKIPDYKLLLQAYLEQAILVVLQRYELDSILNQSHTKVNFLNNALEFDKQFLAYLPSFETPRISLSFEKLIATYPDDIELFEQTLEMDIINEIQSGQGGSYSIKILDQQLPFQLKQLVEKFQAVKSDTSVSIIVNKIIDPILGSVIDIVKHQINEKDYMMLQLKTKQQFSQFLQTVKAIKGCLKLLKTMELQLKHSFQSKKVLQSLQKQLDTILQDHFASKLAGSADLSLVSATNGSQFDQLNTKSSKPFTANDVYEIRSKVESFLQRVRPDLQKQVSLRYSQKITVALLIRLKKYFKAQQHVQGRAIDISDKQPLLDELANYTNMLTQYGYGDLQL